MTPFLSYLGMAALLAAPVQPGAAGKQVHYQKVADGLAWKDPEGGPTSSFTIELPDYQVEITAEGRDRPRVRILSQGKERWAWDEDGHCVFLGRDGVIYRAEYHQMSSGCTIVAFDLKAAKKLWKAPLKGLGPIGHSKYRNQVRMERIDEAVFAVYGHESAGKYVELVDFRTGQTVGHKVFPRD